MKRVVQLDINQARELVSLLREASDEIRRLHQVHKALYTGKVGEPDIAIADDADAAVRLYYDRFKIVRVEDND